MSQLAELQKPETTKQLRMGEAWVKGRVTGYRRSQNGKVHYYLVTVAAKDVYSHPRTIEIACDQPTFNENDDVDIIVSINGYVRNVDYENDEGRRIRYKTADIALSLQNGN